MMSFHLIIKQDCHTGHQSIRSWTSDQKWNKNVFWRTILFSQGVILYPRIHGPVWKTSFQNCVGPGPIGFGPWIPYCRDTLTRKRKNCHPLKDIGGTAGLVFGLNVLIAVNFIRYWIGRLVPKVNSKMRRFRYKLEQNREHKIEQFQTHKWTGPLRFHCPSTEIFKF